MYTCLMCVIQHSIAHECSLGLNTPPGRLLHQEWSTTMLRSSCVTRAFCRPKVAWWMRNFERKDGGSNMWHTALGSLLQQHLLALSWLGVFLLFLCQQFCMLPKCVFFFLDVYYIYIVIIYIYIFPGTPMVVTTYEKGFTYRFTCSSKYEVLYSKG